VGFDRLVIVYRFNRRDTQLWTADQYDVEFNRCERHVDLGLDVQFVEFYVHVCRDQRHDDDQQVRRDKLHAQPELSLHGDGDICACEWIILWHLRLQQHVHDTGYHVTCQRHPHAGRVPGFDGDDWVHWMDGKHRSDWLCLHCDGADGSDRSDGSFGHGSDGLVVDGDGTHGSHVVGGRCDDGLVRQSDGDNVRVCTDAVRHDEPQEQREHYAEFEWEFAVVGTAGIYCVVDAIEFLHLVGHRHDSWEPVAVVRHLAPQMNGQGPLYGWCDDCQPVLSAVEHVERIITER